MPKPYKRGYPVAILIGMEKDSASLWQIFSQVAKLQYNIHLSGNRADSKAIYNFHESIVDCLRPTLKEGIRSIIVASPQKTNYSQQFQNHIKTHQAWLMQGTNRVSLSTLTGAAITHADVTALTKTEAFKRLISETTEGETENLLEILEKRLQGAGILVRFSLEEAENLILYTPPPGKPQPEYLLLTDSYLAESRQKNRVQRLLQIAKNKSVKARIISAESTAGKRLTQLGGLVCLARPV